MRLAALALVAGLIAQAEQTARQPPVFRARTELVQVDVVVVDADGHVVEGLTERDFQIFDRGRPQRVAAFQEISHRRAAPAPLPMDLKVDVADNASQPDRLIVLVLDDLHFQAGSRPEAIGCVRQPPTVRPARTVKSVLWSADPPRRRSRGSGLQPFSRPDPKGPWRPRR
jgi:hypothetical protein